MSLKSATNKRSWRTWLASEFDLDISSNVSFHLTPSIILAVLTPAVFYHYSRRPVIIDSSPLLWMKISTAVLLIAIQVAERKLLAPSCSLSSIVDLMAAASACSIAYIEHRRSAQPSALFGAFLVFDVMYDVNNFFWNSHHTGLDRSEYVFGVTTFLKLAFLALQHMRKQQFSTDLSPPASVEGDDAGGFIPTIMSALIHSLLEVWHVMQLLLGENESLVPDLHPCVLWQQLKNYWPPPLLSSPLQSGDLFIACLKTWKHMLLPMFLTRLAVTAFNCAQPFILRRIIEAVGAQFDNPRSTRECFGLVTTVCTVFSGLAVARASSTYLVNIFAARVRGGVIALQLHKLPQLSEADSKKVPSTLINADIETITAGIPQCLEVLVALIELELGSSLLQHFTGVEMIYVCSPLVLSTIVVYAITRMKVKYLESWNRAAKARVASTGRILQQLTSIKMLGLAPVATAYLQRLRIEEIRLSKWYYLSTGLFDLPCSLGQWAPAAVTIGLALSGKIFNQEMKASTVFPALASVMVIQRASLTVLHSTPMLMGLMASFSRIQHFLAMREKQEQRLLTNEPSDPEDNDETQVARPIIIFDRVDISPPGMRKRLLRGVNFQLVPGSITGVVGPTGAGKSTLLQGLLGEYEIFAGSLHVDSTEIGYCTTEPWLQNTSIRENILGQLDYDSERFMGAIRAGFLEEDLEWLPGGADYVVGINGSYLSDGQRQRLAIARAAYAQKAITLLDDVFRCLDEETAICILHQLCGRNSILRQAGCTVLVVTSLPQCVEIVDQMLFLDGKGHATLDRGYQNPPHPPRIMAALTILNRDSNTPVAVEAKQQQALRRYLQSPSYNSNVAGDGSPRSRWELYTLYANHSALWSNILNSVFILLLSAGELLPDAFLGIWTAFYSQTPTLFRGYAAAAVFPSVFSSLSHWLSFVVHNSLASADFHRKLLSATVGSPQISFVDAPKIAELLSLFSTDISAISRAVPGSIFKIQYAGHSSGVQLCLILTGNLYTCALLPGIVYTVSLLRRGYVHSSRQIRKLDTAAKLSLYAHFEEAAAGSTLIHTFDQQPQIIERGIELLAASQRPICHKHLKLARLRFFLDMMIAGIAVAIVALALLTKGSSTESSIAHSYHNLFLFAWALQEAIIAFTTVDTTFESLERIVAFTEKPRQESGKEYADLPGNWPAAGSVELQNVFACYTPGVGASPCLRRISLSILPREHIGISGSSGSGKTSLFLAMLGLIRYWGSIRIDGIELSSVEPSELRSRLVTITQDEVVFDGTIRTNLLPLTMADSRQGPEWKSEKDKQKDCELEQLLKRLHIWTPLVTKGGLDAVVDNVGYLKGDLQLLSIARAIIKQRETGSKVVLIDDATSELSLQKMDTANRLMGECFAGCTVLRVSSRQSGLQDVSSIIRLRRGAIVPGHQNSDDRDSDEEEE